jgi:hypothetical protein
MTHLLIALAFGALCVILYKNKMLWPSLGIGIVALIIAVLTGMDSNASEHHHHHHHKDDDC